ncbi:MAG: hypothetical protein EXR75_12580 [Myxococcales bacterium]|nr:hypothetical protein [Myxococcales bacterium]
MTRPRLARPTRAPATRGRRRITFDKCWGNNDSGQLGLGDTKNRGDAAGGMGDFLKPGMLTGPSVRVFQARRLVFSGRLASFASRRVARRREASCSSPVPASTSARARPGARTWCS